jgi:hypothetical protein
MDRFRRGTGSSNCTQKTASLPFHRVSSETTGSRHPEAGGRSLIGPATPALVETPCLDAFSGTRRRRHNNFATTARAAFRRLVGEPSSQIASSLSGKGNGLTRFFAPPGRSSRHPGESTLARLDVFGWGSTKQDLHHLRIAPVKVR